MAKELKNLTKRADNYSQWYNDKRGCRCRLGRRMPHRKICVRLEQPVAYSKGTTAVIHSTHVSDSGFSLNIFCTCLDIRERSCNFT